MQHPSQLDGNVTAANDGHVFWQIRQIEEAITRNAEFCSINIGDHRGAASGD